MSNTEQPNNEFANGQQASQPSEPAYGERVSQYAPPPEYAQQPMPQQGSEHSQLQAPQGYAVPQYQPVVAVPGTNVLSIISLVTAIVGISLAGVICGHIALNQIKKTGEQGRGMAIAGLVIGYIGLGVVALFVLAYVFFAIVFGIGALSAYSSPY